LETATEHVPAQIALICSMFVAPYTWFEAGERGAQRGNKKADDVEERK
jgi:hypothetical protein